MMPEFSFCEAQALRGQAVALRECSVAGTWGLPGWGAVGRAWRGAASGYPRGLVFSYRHWVCSFLFAANWEVIRYRKNTMAFFMM